MLFVNCTQHTERNNKELQLAIRTKFKSRSPIHRGVCVSVTLEQIFKLCKCFYFANEHLNEIQWMMNNEHLVTGGTFGWNNFRECSLWIAHSILSAITVIVNWHLRALRIVQCAVALCAHCLYINFVSSVIWALCTLNITHIVFGHLSRGRCG